MAIEHPMRLTAAAPPRLAALAEQLREGPLQQLLALETEIAELTQRSAAECQADRVADVERLVRLSVAAMEQFNTFTRELAAVVRELTATHGSRH